MRAFITVIGKDKVGIIAAVCVLLSEQNVNILDISQTLFQESFTMIMQVDMTQSSAPFETLSERLTQLGEMRELGVQPGYRRHFAGQLLKQFAVAEGGKSGCAAQDQHRDSLCKKGCGRPGSNDQSTPIKRRERTLHHACVEGRVF